MRDLLRRVKDWRRGYFQPAFDGAVDDPPVCQCGHYRYRHTPGGCFGWARDQWATLGSLTLSLRCRCRIVGPRSASTTSEERS